MCLCKRLNFTASSSAQPNQSRTPCFPLDPPPPTPHEAMNHRICRLPCYLATLPRLVVSLVVAAAAASAPFDALCIAFLPYRMPACPVSTHSLQLPTNPYKPHCIPIDLPGVFLPPASWILPAALVAQPRNAISTWKVSNVEIPMHFGLTCGAKGSSGIPIIP